MRYQKTMVLGMMLLLTACARPTEQMQDVWLETAALDAQETPQTLYEKALEEEPLLILSETTRLISTAESFQEQYPGLIATVRDIRAVDIGTLLEDGALENGDYLCDLVMRNDNDGVLSNRMVPNGILYSYLPEDIASHYPDAQASMVDVMQEAELCVYNDRLCETQPITNLWELTEETWRGRVIMANPLRSISASILLNTIVCRSEDMEHAYMEYYGVPFVGKNDENAGETFVRMLMENDLILMNSSDEAVERIGGVGVNEVYIGISISSKLRYTSVGYSLAPLKGLAPFDGVLQTNTISMVRNAKSPSSAKLFVRWLLGEADGQGEGYQPFLQNGSWPVRTDVQGHSVFEIEEFNLVQNDRELMYETIDDFLAFWSELLVDNVKAD